MQFRARGMVEMLGYLSKFVLQMLPTISATVIGAYIVSTWINPKAPPEPAKVSARAQEPAKPVPAPVQESQPAQDASAEPVDTKPIDARPAAETAKPVKGTGSTEKVRIIPIVRQANQASETVPVSTASIAAPEAATAPDERKDAVKDPNKDANELARAAIQRLRGGESIRSADEPVKPAVATARAPSLRATPDVPPPFAAVAPPLPPAVSIAAPRIAPGDSADQAVASYPDRLSPPAEIPAARNPLNLQASARIPENPSIADDFLSATKSFFRALTP